LFSVTFALKLLASSVTRPRVSDNDDRATRATFEFIRRVSEQDFVPEMWTTVKRAER